MKIRLPDLSRLFPLGWPWQATCQAWTGSLVVSALGAVCFFLYRFQGAKEALYIPGPDMLPVLDPEARIAPFPQIFGNALFGFWVVALCLLLLPIFHYLWHGQGSKSIYLMRRLPRRSELWRRCLAGPAVLLGLTLLAGALTLLLCFACYRSLTPAGHLPEDLWAGIGGISC